MKSTNIQVKCLGSRMFQRIQ